MRVAVTIEQCWHDVPGGVATSALESIRALRAAPDLQIDLVGVAARHAAPPPEPFVPPIEVRHLPLPRLALYESWHRLRRPRVQAATGPVDVIHVTGMAMPPRSAPMVVTVHDLAFLDDPSQFTPRGVRFFHRAIDLARRDADIVVCPSEATAAACRRNGFAARRLRVVPWGIEVQPAAPTDIDRVRRAYRLERPFVLWLGTIEPRKNVPALLDAFARLGRDDVELVIAGGAGWNDELAAIERRSPAGVRRVGFVPAADLPGLYAAAAAFCFPSRQEGFGLPVLEAMAQGTPVVTSVGTATAEVVGDAGLTVDPGDPGAIADALASLLDDPDRADQLGAAGRARAAADFTWSATATGLAAAYRDAIELAAGEPTGARRRRRTTPSTGAAPAPVPAPGPAGRGPTRVGLNLLWLVPGVVGGSEEYTTRLLEAMAAEATPDLELVLFVNSSFPPAYPGLMATYRAHVAPVSGRHKGVRVGAETTWLGEQARRLDIDVMHHMGGILPAWRPTPCVLTIHDLQPLVLPEHFAPPKRLFNGIAVPRSVRAADSIVTLTGYTKRDLVARLGVEPDRIVVVPPGFGRGDARLEGTDGAVVRAVYALGDRPFFFFPAITYPHKNHLMLLEAFADLHRTHPEALLVLTSGEAQMGGAVTEAIERLGLTAHVRRLGRIPERDIVALYQEATALTFPSTYEGFGLPVLEAMSCGCPVLASDATALPEAVGGAGILLPPQDPTAWTAAMTRVLTDPAWAAELAAAGSARIASFDWHASALLQIDVYRRAIRDRR